MRTCPRSPAQSQGRSDIEVVQVAGTTEAGRGVDQDTSCLHLQSKAVDLVFLDGINIHCCGVASAAFIDQLSADFQSFVEVLSLVHTEQRAQLFVCPCVVMAGVIGLEDHDFGVGGNSDASHLCQLQHAAAESVGVNTVSLSVEEDLSNLVSFVLVQEVAAGC